MMFRDEDQRRAVARTLADMADAPFWDENANNLALLPPESSAGTAALYGVSLAVLGKDSGPSIGELLTDTKPTHMAALGSLLAAIGKGPAAVDAWIVEDR